MPVKAMPRRATADPLSGTGVKIAFLSPLAVNETVPLLAGLWMVITRLTTSLGVSVIKELVLAVLL